MRLIERGASDASTNESVDPLSHLFATWLLLKFFTLVHFLTRSSFLIDTWARLMGNIIKQILRINYIQELHQRRVYFQ